MTNSQDQIAEGSSVFFEGRAWFDKANGNTYHSVRIWIDGDVVAIVPLTYGYENAYQSSAISKLVELGYLPEFLDNRKTREYPIWQIDRWAKINTYSVLTYGKKSELWKVAK